jgi:hypothetical protein
MKFAITSRMEVVDRTIDRLMNPRQQGNSSKTIDDTPISKSVAFMSRS